jgi:hypothetical protein
LLVLSFKSENQQIPFHGLRKKLDVFLPVRSK